jgi:signal peptidase I
VTHRSRPRPRAAYDRWWVWAGIVAVFMLVVEPAVTSVFQRAGQGVVLHEDSMSPTLLKYDCVMIHKTITTRERGEVVGIARGGAREPFVARVIGLPGDRVAVRRGEAVVNGVPLTEPYVRLDVAPRTEVEAVTVPTRRLFVIGDNRNAGGGGGLVAEQDVLGRANLIYFSQDPATRAIRWARIGQPVR